MLCNGASPQSVILEHKWNGVLGAWPREQGNPNGRLINPGGTLSLPTMGPPS